MPQYEVYSDGSYIDGCIGYGAVVLCDGELFHEISGTVRDADALSSRQVGGELYAVLAALDFCAEHAIDEIKVYYDYQGVASWATAEWKTNLLLTRSYAAKVRASKVKIRWQKVAAHTGDKWNERADVLAKQGALSSVSSSPSKKNNVNISINELIARLEERAAAFELFLNEHGVAAVFGSIMNEQYARIDIIDSSGRVGMIDLYNTAKKPFSPDFRGFKNDELKSLVAGLWREFCSKA